MTVELKFSNVEVGRKLHFCQRILSSAERRTEHLAILFLGFLHYHDFGRFEVAGRFDGSKVKLKWWYTVKNLWCTVKKHVSTL